MCHDDGRTRVHFAPRSLADLKMGQAELFALVAEGICPGCNARLEIRDVNELNRRYSDRCGWCERCQWGWSATIFRATDEDHVWRDGEQLVTCYSAGALVEMNYIPGEPTFQVRFLTELELGADFTRAYLKEWT